MTEQTATGWYYALQGERVGPRSLDEVRSLVANGVLDADALVWTSGMRDWARVADMPILAASWVSPQAAPAPPADTGWAATDRPRRREPDTAPHPWKRLGARMVDILVYSMALTLVLGIAAPGLVARVPRDTTEINPLLNLLLIPVLALMEVAVLHWVGTTPGKALFAIRVTTAGGERPSLAQTASRTARVWVVGMGLGLPIISLVAAALGYFRLASRGRTWWDESLDLRVEHGRITPLSAMTLIGFFIFFVLVLAVAATGMAPK